MTKLKRFSVIAALVAALMSAFVFGACVERKLVEVAEQVGGHDGESCLDRH